MKQEKKVGLHLILSELKAGLNQKEISKKYSIPKQTTSYNVGKLVELGCVEKIGHGVSSRWEVIKEVPNRPKGTMEVKSGLHEIRGHAFIWNIEFLQEAQDWNQIITNYKKRYPKSKLTFKMICGGKVPRTIFKGRKIWLTKSGLTIYEPLDFFGKSSFSVKGSAVYEMDRLVKDLVGKLGLKMQYYKFKCSREHFAHVKNQMARQFNENKQKIKVGIDGKWFWIDHSHGEHEEETNDANISRQAQIKYKEEVADGFNTTRPSVINANFEESAKQIKKNAENLDYHAENMRSHVGAVRILGSEVKALRQERNETAKLFKRIAEALEKNG